MTGPFAVVVVVVVAIDLERAAVMHAGQQPE